MNISKCSLGSSFRRRLLWAVLVLTLTLFSSCAFHKTFPFICFKKDCIKQQFDHPGKQIGGYKKGGKPVGARSKKSKKKRKKKHSGLAGASRTPIDKAQLDLMISDTLPSKESIKILFRYKLKSPERTSNIDSTFIKSSLLTLSKNDMVKINYYLEKYEVNNIDEVVITPVIDDKNVDFKKNNRLAQAKANKVVHHLIKAGVKKKKIKIFGSRGS